MYLFNKLHTAYLRIEFFDGVAKQLMKNVVSGRTRALITSQGVTTLAAGVVKDFTDVHIRSVKGSPLMWVLKSFKIEVLR